MTVQEIINNYTITGTITENVIEKLQTNDITRSSLANYFKTNKDRAFALSLLNKFVEMRKENKPISSDDIMYACYILGLHENIEDSIKIWSAKTTDFDTFCAVDIQLAMFAGVEETIDYLEKEKSPEAKDAHKYILECREAGDLDCLEEYFSGDGIWFI